MKIPDNAEFRIIVTSAEVETTEVTYKDGEIAGSGTVWTPPSGNDFPSAEEVIKFYSDCTGAPEGKDKWYVNDDGELCCTFHVDVGNCPVGDADVAAWEKGERRMWSAFLVIKLNFANVWDVEEDDVVALGIAKF